METVLKFLAPMMVFLLVIAIRCDSKEFKYFFEFDDEKIFSNCKDQPEDVLTIYEQLDFSELNSKIDEAGIHVTGNVTYIWDIKPSDRIRAKVNLYYFDRGDWAPTVFSLFVKDYCAVIYDRNQYWYQFVFKHVKNMDEVKSKCVTPGTKLMFNEFLLEMTLITSAQMRSGRYKVQFLLEAFNQSNVKYSSVCYELTGVFNQT